MLSLRDGIPEMQIGKADILVSIKGGRRLNDGAWHLVNVSLEYCLVQQKQVVPLLSFLCWFWTAGIAQ